MIRGGAAVVGIVPSDQPPDLNRVATGPAEWHPRGIRPVTRPAAPR